MRHVFEPVKVETDQRGTPARVFWGRRTFVVSRVVDRWRYVGKWWLIPNGQRRTYYRLEARPTHGGGRLSEARVIEVFKQDDGWVLSYLCD